LIVHKELKNRIAVCYICKYIIKLNKLTNLAKVKVKAKAKANKYININIKKLTQLNLYPFSFFSSINTQIERHYNIMITLGLLPLVILVVILSFVNSNFQMGQCPNFQSTATVTDSINGVWYELARSKYSQEEGVCTKFLISGSPSCFNIEYKTWVGLYPRVKQVLNIVSRSIGDPAQNLFTYEVSDINGDAVEEQTLFPAQQNLVMIYKLNENILIQYSCKNSVFFIDHFVKEHQVRVLSRERSPEVGIDMTNFILTHLRVNLGFEESELDLPRQDAWTCESLDRP